MHRVKTILSSAVAFLVLCFVFSSIAWSQPRSPSSTVKSKDPAPATGKIRISTANDGNTLITIDITYPEQGTPPAKDAHVQVEGGLDADPVPGWEGPPGWDSVRSGRGTVLTFRALPGAAGLPPGPTTFRLQPRGDEASRGTANGSCAVTTDGGTKWPTGPLDKNSNVAFYVRGDSDRPLPLPTSSVRGRRSGTREFLEPPSIFVAVGDTVSIEFVFEGGNKGPVAFAAHLLEPVSDPMGEFPENIVEVFDESTPSEDGLLIEPARGLMGEDSISTLVFTPTASHKIFYSVFAVDSNGDDSVDISDETPDVMTWVVFEIP